MGMKWSEASLSPEEPLHLREEGGDRGQKGTSSRYEGEEANFIKRAKKKTKTNGGKIIKVFAWCVTS